jgi:transcriptional regulator with XRE-family HTH domain
MTPESIRAFRERREWSQQRLAKQLGVDQATVSRIEHGADPSGPVRRLLEKLMEEPDISEHAA